MDETNAAENAVGGVPWKNLHMKGVRVRTLRGTWGVGSVEEDPNVSNSRLSIDNIESTLYREK